MGKGLRRQTPLQEKPIATFKKKEVQADESNLTNQITLTGYDMLQHLVEASIMCAYSVHIFMSHAFEGSFRVKKINKQQSQ